MHKKSQDDVDTRVGPGAETEAADGPHAQSGPSVKNDPSKGAPPRLGELLIAQGQITREQLAIALARQKESGHKLGEELVRAGFVKRSVISRALRIQRRITYAAICSTIAVSTISHDVDAASAHRGQIAVTAFVPARAVSQVDRQASELVVSVDDIARGYVDVAAGSRLRVTANSNDGYVVDVLTRLPIFKSVQVSIERGNADIGPDGGTIVMRGRRGRNMALDVSYRFRLAEEVRPGTYAWPLAINVRPL